MTLTFELDLDRVKMNHHAIYLGQKSFSSKVIARTHRHTHCHARTGPFALPGPLKWSVNMHTRTIVDRCRVQCYFRRSTTWFVTRLKSFTLLFSRQLLLESRIVSRRSLQKYGAVRVVSRRLVYAI